MTRQYLTIFFLTITVMLLNACSLIPPLPSPTVNTYVLSYLPTIKPENTKPQSATLLITVPLSSPIYNTTLIPYIKRRYAVNYLANNRWILPPPQMLQYLIQEVLTKTNHFAYVGIDTSGQKYNFVLRANLDKFLLNYTTNTPTVDVVLTVELINSKNVIIDRQTFAVSQYFTQGDIYSGIRSANQAIAKILAYISAMCLKI